MDLLVLDTIHGGKEIGNALIAAGHHVDMVDVYLGTGTGEGSTIEGNSYDRIIVPVHLNPDHPILQQFRNTPRITHHEAVKWILGNELPSLLIEVTGAQGKTTTAHAIAHILPGHGILHTSSGTYRYPEHEKLFRRSITPASLIAAVHAARDYNGWLVAEVSLGVTGAGDLAIITSDLDYRCAAGKKSALTVKIETSANARRLLVAPGVRSSRNDTVHADKIVRMEGTRCDYDHAGLVGSIENPLLNLAGYKTPLMIAAAAGCMLGFNPGSLRDFTALSGRMSVTSENGHHVVDNANSGSTSETTIEACRYARSISGEEDLVLVIGQEAHAVCEGFQPEEIIRTIENVRPCRVVIVGEQYRNEYMASSLTRYLETNRITYTCNLGEGKSAAIANTGNVCVVLAVKSWR
jgi:hypothetical protein